LLPLSPCPHQAGINKDSVDQAVHHHRPYHGADKRTVDAAWLNAIERSAAHAAALQTVGRPASEALAVLDRAASLDVGRRHAALSKVLGPFTLGDRHSSYGRHFISGPVLDAITTRLGMFVRTGDWVVDFSCGHNEWVSRVKAAALEQGAVIAGRSYDIVVAKRKDGFVRKSWMEVTSAAEGALSRGWPCFFKICASTPWRPASSVLKVRHFLLRRGSPQRRLPGGGPQPAL
jgi:hypothetical protein